MSYEVGDLVVIVTNELESDGIFAGTLTTITGFFVKKKLMFLGGCNEFVFCEDEISRPSNLHKILWGIS